MATSAAEKFLTSDTSTRLRMVKSGEGTDELKKLLGDAAFEEYHKLSREFDENHLSIDSPKNLIFVPGVMGSLLQSRTLGGIWWIDVRTRNRIDQLGLSDDGTQDSSRENDIAPVTSDPMYDPFLQAVLEQPDFGHVIFAYDWRKALVHSSGEFRDLVVRLHSSNGGLPVYIVAHSMGGLMVRAALMNHGAELWPLIGKIVFIGTPHYGSPSIAGYLKNHLWGFDTMALLGLYLSRATLRSLWGVLAMLPAPRGIYPGTRTGDPDPWGTGSSNGSYVHPCSNFDMYDAEQWKLDLPEDQNFKLQRVLDGARDFHLRMWETHQALNQSFRDRMTVIAGAGVKTLFRLAYEPGFFGLWERTEKTTERIPGDRHRDGDGRVPVASAALENVEVRYVNGVHGGLPNIRAVYEDVFRCLRGEAMKLPSTLREALSTHLAAGDESEAPHLDGSSRRLPFSDDPGYWVIDSADAAHLSELNELLAQERLPEFIRVRLL